jgi:hypothetical protein
MTFFKDCDPRNMITARSRELCLFTEAGASTSPE